MARSSNGIITSSMLSDAGIARQYLKILADEGALIRVDRGVYALPDAWEDELFILQYRYRKGIYSHETALYLHDFSDRAPSRFSMTFPYGYHAAALIKDISFTTSVKELYNAGVTTLASPAGHPLRVYCLERTLCDIVRGRHGGDIALVQSAMKKYATSKKRNIPLLLDFAEKLHVTPKIRTYMEILL